MASRKTTPAKKPAASKAPAKTTRAKATKKATPGKKATPAKTAAGVLDLDTFEGCLDHALSQVAKGTALEFGVASGGTLRRIVDGMPRGSRVVGFDWFQGLPEHWREGFDAGAFYTSAPDVPGAELVIGLFAQTLAGWTVPDDIALVHIDCDLYSSTCTVLEHVGSHLKKGCLVVFDEYHGYPGSEEHEAKAWSEWAESSGVTWTELAKGPEQLLIRIDGA